MNINDLRPASAISQGFGVKCLAYGPPGTGKTPTFASAPRPVLCVVEPGMLSMRSFTNLPAFEAYTPSKIDEFFAWCMGSHEARNFDTIGIDSVSQMAELYLAEGLAAKKDGRAAYGVMSQRMMKHLDDLYFMQYKHAFLIAKEGKDEAGGVTYKRPFFPGQDLNIKVPHRYDLVARIARVQVPGQAEVACMQTAATFDVLARDRSGKLAAYEPLNLAAVFAKAMT